MYITFSHLADAFIQSDLQTRTIEAIKTNKRAMIHDKSRSTSNKLLKIYIINKKNTERIERASARGLFCICLKQISFFIHIFSPVIAFCLYF